MNTERMTQILLEVTNGVAPPAHESAEDAAVRARLKVQVDEIRAKGGIVDIPAEWPGEGSPETAPPPESKASDRFTDWDSETLK